jgi:hypothetical protein
MGKVRISGGPHPSTVKIVDVETGEEVQGVYELHIVVRVGDVTTAHLSLLPTEIDIVAEKEVV